MSKGGLLHHFKSREALTAGLVAKMRELAENDFALMAEDPLYNAALFGLSPNRFQQGEVEALLDVVAALKSPGGSY